MIQICRWVHTEQLNLKPSILLHLCIFHIILIQVFINVQEITNMKIKVQHFPFKETVTSRSGRSSSE